VLSTLTGEEILALLTEEQILALKQLLASKEDAPPKKRKTVADLFKK